MNDSKQHKQSSMPIESAMDVVDHSSATTSYESMAMISALLCGIALGIDVDNIDTTNSGVVFFVFRLAIALVAAGNLLATCVLGLVSFYMHQLTEKNHSQLGQYHVFKVFFGFYKHRNAFFFILICNRCI
jgi:hypothetical protein